jgi:hypothetical protein
MLSRKRKASKKLSTMLINNTLQAADNNATSLRLLPMDMIKIILSYADIAELRKWRMTCKELMNLVEKTVHPRKFFLYGRFANTNK